MSYIKLHQDESPNEYDQINQVINEPLTKTDLLNKTTRLNTIKKISSLTAMMILTFCFFLLEQITGNKNPNKFNVSPIKLNKVFHFYLLTRSHNSLKLSSC